MENHIHSRDLQGFNNLIQELLQGGPNRAAFRAWEMQLLIDLGSYQMKRFHRKTMLSC
jgi:hypothetical protein